MRRIVLLCFTLIYGNVWAQSVDSIRNILKAGKTGDTTFILAQAELAYQLYSTNPDSSLWYANAARQNAEKLKFEKGLGRALRVIGIYHWSKGEYSQALELINDALSHSQKANDKKGIAGCYGNIGVIYRNQGSYGKALQFQLKSLALREQINDSAGIATTYNNIGLIYKEQGNHEKSLEYLIKSLAIQRRIGDRSGIARACNNIGSIYQLLKQYDKSIEYQIEAISLQEKINDQRGLTLSYGNLADSYVLSNNPQLALPYLERGLAIAKQIASADRVASLQTSFARYYNHIKKPQLAFEYSGEAAKLMSMGGNVEVYRDAIFEKYKAAEALHHSDEALNDYKLFITLNDSVQSQAGNKKALALEYAFKEEKIKIEQEKKELQHLAEREHQKRITNTFGGIAITLVIISMLIIRTNRKIRAQQQQLEKQSRELALQNEQLIQTKEEISAQHDALAAQNAELTEARQIIEHQHHAIQLKNETLEEEVEERTRELMEYNEQLEEFAFITAHNLRAPVARILGLGQLLKHSKPDEALSICEKMVYTTTEIDQVVRDLNMILAIRKDNPLILAPVNFSDVANMALTFLEKEISATNANIALDFSDAESVVSVKTYVDNILINLLSNSLKYRDPQRVPSITISTKRVDEYICLTISDNGLGIDMTLFGKKIFTLYSRFHTHVEGKGIGLYLVKAHVTALGGKVEVASEPGRGSTFSIFLRKDIDL
jgi:signal transduction histidine kinase